MIPINFPEANTRFGPPSDLEESQCQTIYAFVGEVAKGSCDGASQVVVCWKPTDSEIEKINSGHPIFLSVLGGLPPHFLTTSFEEAMNPL